MSNTIQNARAQGLSCSHRGNRRVKHTSIYIHVKLGFVYAGTIKEVEYIFTGSRPIGRFVPVAVWAVEHILDLVALLIQSVAVRYIARDRRLLGVRCRA